MDPLLASRLGDSSFLRADHTWSIARIRDVSRPSNCWCNRVGCMGTHSWLLLVTIHQEGRVRIWLSLPIVVLAYLAVGFVIAGSA